MAHIETNRNRIFAAEVYLASLGLSTTNLYFYIGKTTAWQPSDDALDNPIVSDNSPPNPVDSDNTIRNYVWQQMLSAKRVQASNCSLAAMRWDWTLNTVYRQYDPTIDLFDPEISMVPFYVVTTNLDVYKCLFNNNGGPSYIEPSGQYTNTITTQDQYVWKYMFSISVDNAAKFLTNQYIPIYDLTADDGSFQWQVQQNAVAGSIEVIDVINPGSGYIVAPIISVSGDGTGCTAIAVISSAGQIQKIIVTNIGANYTYANVVITSGQVSNISLINSGSGYLVAPTITFAGGGGSGAAGAALINSSGQVTGFTLSSGGGGYTSAPNVVISAPPSGTTATAFSTISSGATAQAILGPQNGHGSDPVFELGGFNVLITNTLSNNENGVFTVDNSYRIDGVILNPLLVSTGQPATAVDYSQTYDLTVTNITNGTFNPNDNIIGQTSGTTAIVVDFNSSTNVLRVYSPSTYQMPVFLAGETIQNANFVLGTNATLQTTSGAAQSGGTASITIALSDSGTENAYAGFSIHIISGTGAGQQKVIVSNDITSKIVVVNSNWSVKPDHTSTYSIADIGYPSFIPNTGQVLDIEYRRPILRQNNQSESVGLVINF